MTGGFGLCAALLCSVALPAVAWAGAGAKPVQLGAFASAAGADRAVELFAARDPALRGRLAIAQANVSGRNVWRVTLTDADDKPSAPPPLPDDTPVPFIAPQETADERKTRWRGAAARFDPIFMSGAQAVDLSRYAYGNPVLPGTYQVDLSLNGVMQGRAEVTVKAMDGQADGRVCLTPDLLALLNVDTGKLTKDAAARLADGDCAAIGDVLPGATLTLDASDLVLRASVPHALLLRTPRGHVNPALWDAGTDAAMLGYTFNAYANRAGGVTRGSVYLGLNAGLNLGGWYARHNGAMSWRQGGPARYQVQDAYVQHDMNLLGVRGRLTLGQSGSNGDLFGSMPFLGAQAMTDDMMLPDSRRGYAPVIRGIAQTNARVTVRQNGVLLYDTAVPPGAFEIDDLYPTGYGGNLDVTVTEADGAQHSSTIAYAAVPDLLRLGQWRFSGAGGSVRYPGIGYRPGFVQATARHGFANAITGYAGVQATGRYAAGLAGLAFGTPIGAFSTDVTVARTDLGGKALTGASVRVSYSKFVQRTGSNLALAAYRFSSRGFLDLPTAIMTIDAARRGLDGGAILRPRNRLSVSANQSLGRRWGQLAFTGYLQDYWNDRTRRDRQYQLSYNNRLGRLSYALSTGRSRDAGGRAVNQFMVTLSMPLGRNRHAPHMAMTANHGDATGTAGQISLSGIAGRDDQFSYGVTGAYAGGMVSGSANGQYRAPFVTAQASYGQGPGYRSASAGLSGTIIGYGGGLAFSPHVSQGQTIGLIEAPDAAGARVIGYPGVRIGPGGRAVAPYLTPYRLNEVAIDPRGLPGDVALDITSRKTAPRAGAIVLLKYKTSTGRALTIESRQEDGRVLPFGAEVADGDSGESVGVVGQGGRMVVRLKGAGRSLHVSWGKDAGQRCAIALPDPGDDAQHLFLPCQTPGKAARHD